MTSDDPIRTRDVAFRPVGIGMQLNFKCLGCAQTRLALGSKGVGVRKRCGACIEKRKAAA